MKSPTPFIHTIRVLALLALMTLGACGTPTVELSANDAVATADDANIAQIDGESGDVGIGQDTAVDEPNADTINDEAPNADDPDTNDANTEDPNTEDPNTEIDPSLFDKVKFCKLGANSCAADEYCKANTCDAGNVGLCTKRPSTCFVLGKLPDVCGCDGLTYNNACEAAKDGVNVDYAGQCKPNACKLGEGDCGAGEFCKTDSCGAGALGVCTARPSKCVIAPTEEPVCGCDGETYDNGCAAARDGVNVASEGACKVKICLLGADTCAEGQFCEAAPGTCNVFGVCRVKPTLANVIYKPVCGCDGKTYKNDILRRLAEVSFDHAGVCLTNLPLLCQVGGDSCGDDAYCHGSNGVCGGPGVCTPRAKTCNDLLNKPVCGCDGVVYPSSCHASQAGKASRSLSYCK